MTKPYLTEPFRKQIRQLAHYAFVGIVNNAAGYLLYLFLTSQGAPPKATMSVLYAAGATFGYWGNRKLTFSDRGRASNSGLRYAVAYAAGYVLNYSLLYVFVDHLGLPHQLVQGCAIFILAAFLFIASKYYVFPQHVASKDIEQCKEQ